MAKNLNREDDNGSSSSEGLENLRRHSDESSGMGKTGRLIAGVAGAALLVLSLRRKRLRPVLLPIAIALKIRGSHCATVDHRAASAAPLARTAPSALRPARTSWSAAKKPPAASAASITIANSTSARTNPRHFALKARAPGGTLIELRLAGEPSPVLESARTVPGVSSADA